MKDYFGEGGALIYVIDKNSPKFTTGQDQATIRVTIDYNSNIGFDGSGNREDVWITIPAVVDTGILSDVSFNPNSDPANRVYDSTCELNVFLEKARCTVELLPEEVSPYWFNVGDGDVLWGVLVA